MQTPEQPPINELRQFLKTCGIDFGLLISGLSGAILLLSKNGIQSFSKAMFGLIGGAASANYLTPVVIKIMKIDEGLNFNYGIAFLLGFLGLRGIEFFANKIFPIDPQKPNSTTNRK